MSAVYRFLLFVSILIGIWIPQYRSEVFLTMLLCLVAAITEAFRESMSKDNSVLRRQMEKNAAQGPREETVYKSEAAS